MNSDLKSSWLHGNCEIMALALHELTGLPLVVIVGTTAPDAAGNARRYALHAGVLADDHLYLDVRGLQPVAGSPNDDFRCPEPVDQIEAVPVSTAEELFDWFGMTHGERLVNQARLYAENHGPVLAALGELRRHEQQEVGAQQSLPLPSC